MIRKSIPLVLVFVLLATYAPLAFAQQSGSTRDWSSVQQLKTNEQLIVKQKSGKDLEGVMIEATDSTLTIDRKGKPVAIPRADVRQVLVIEGKANKAKWALIGAGIGAGAGTGIGATKYRSDRDDYGIYIYMGTFIGTGVGAVSGLLFGQTRRKRTIVYTTD
ncbi:MAG TPA: hypothetical protein VGW58_04895 [Pyrinomonadaceae bacterium]|nr:hypothetical protein [Pyrinomonadaceae bacterium]